jgi:outer membrane receptor protein involved in Fe transport
VVGRKPLSIGGYPEGHWVQWEFEPYLQDDWHVSKRLTLNIGVRYYLPTPYHDVSAHSLDSLFLPNLYNPAAEAQLDTSGNLIPGTGHTCLTYGNGLVPCGTASIHAGCQEPFRGGFAPRVGFAWDPTGSGETSIRGGYGISYDVSNGNEGASGFFGNPPDVTTPSVYNVVGYNTVSTGIIPHSGMSTVSYRPKYPSIQQFSFDYSINSRAIIS